jgi:hypothetical protein
VSAARNASSGRHHACGNAAVFALLRMPYAPHGHPGGCVAPGVPIRAVVPQSGGALRWWGCTLLLSPQRNRAPPPRARLVRGRHRVRLGNTASYGFPGAHVLVLMASSALPANAARAVDAVDMRALAARLRDCAHDVAVLVNVCNEIAAGVTAHPARSLEARAAGVLPLVLDALNMHAQHELLATSACWALSTLCGVGSSSDAPTLDASVAAAVTRAATVALAAHGAQSARCATTAALMIGNWSMTMRQQYNDASVSTAACDAGAVPALALAMQAHAEDADVQQWCARALVALMVALGSAGDTAHVRAHAADYARARDAAVAALQRHAATSRDVANEACGLICNIAERLPEQRAAPAAQAVSAVLAAMQAHDVVVRGQATLALETLICTRSELGDHASDAAGRAAAEGGAFGALAAGLEQAQAAGCEGRSRFGMLFMASCSALACVAPYAHACAAALQPGQAARATEAVCAALRWSLAESNLRRNAHALGQDKLQAMQLASTVYAAMNLGISARGHFARHGRGCAAAGAGGAPGATDAGVPGCRRVAHRDILSALLEGRAAGQLRRMRRGCRAGGGGAEEVRCLPRGCVLLHRLPAPRLDGAGAQGRVCCGRSRARSGRSRRLRRAVGYCTPARRPAFRRPDVNSCCFIEHLWLRLWRCAHAALLLR